MTPYYKYACTNCYTQYDYEEEAEACSCEMDDYPDLADEVEGEPEDENSPAVPKVEGGWTCLKCGTNFSEDVDAAEACCTENEEFVELAEDETGELVPVEKLLTSVEG